MHRPGWGWRGRVYRDSRRAMSFFWAFQEGNRALDRFSIIKTGREARRGVDWGGLPRPGAARTFPIPLFRGRLAARQVARNRSPPHARSYPRPRSELLIDLPIPSPRCPWALSTSSLLAVGPARTSAPAAARRPRSGRARARRGSRRPWGPRRTISTRPTKFGVRGRRIMFGLGIASCALGRLPIATPTRRGLHSRSSPNVPEG